MKYKRFILISLVLLEWVVVLLIAHRTIVALKRQKDVLGTKIITRINKDSVNFPEISSFPYYYEPKSNYTATQSADWLPYTATYISNSEGLRSTKEYPVQKESNVFRIVAIGDSFTYGQYVNEADTFVSQLENQLNAQLCSNRKKFEVLNLGVPGYDIRYEVERFRRHGQRYHPDLVIWLVNGFNLNTIVDLTQPIQDEIIRTASQEVIAKHNSENDFYFASGQAIQIIKKKYGIDYIISKQREAMATFSNLYRGRLLIIMFANSDLRAVNIIRDYAKGRANTYFNDKIPPLLRENDTILQDGHPSASGHASIAGSIFQYINNNHVISCD